MKAVRAGLPSSPNTCSVFVIIPPPPELTGPTANDLLHIQVLYEPLPSTAEILVNVPGALMTSESGDTASFDIVLSAVPTDDVSGLCERSNSALGHSFVIRHCRRP